MTELELIVDLHRHSERQGPGSVGETLMALQFMNLPRGRELNVADIGCGSGGPTITLAQNLIGQITAVDIFKAFLDELDVKSKELGLSDKINTLQCSMDDLPFGEDEFDIIWSEGAIYNIGFENGVKKWKEYLKPGGYIAVSEITWLTDSRPSELEDFWNREYPEIDTASNKIEVLERNGYTLAGYFPLAVDGWIKNYYEPLESKFESFLERHGHSDLARAVVEEHRREFELYRAYKDYYSYGFYVAQI